VLVDGGPPGGGVAGKLREAGAGELAAAIVTHDQSDHAGGIREMLGELPVHRLLYAWAGHALLDQARAAGAAPLRVAEGSEVRSGALRVEVLWPPRVLLSGPAPPDPNQLSLVLLARWRGFSMLLTGDAEAESVPIDPGPVDVLKVAHHGSEDAGLAELLERSSPRLAVISVGEDNPFGHPAPATLATLAEHGVPVLRTDHDGTAVLEAGRGRLRAGGN
jgi:competence protein ComEC